MTDIERKIEEIIRENTEWANGYVVFRKIIPALAIFLEDEKRKAFEAARTIKNNDESIAAMIESDLDFEYPTYESYVSSSPSEKK